MSLITLLFDNDGVLVDTEPVFFAATREIFSSIGIELTEQWFIEEQLRFNTSPWELPETKRFSADEIALFRQMRDDLYTTRLRQGVTLMPGVMSTLQALHGDYRLAVVTSSKKSHLQVIFQSAGIGHFFDFLITQDDITHQKPHPEAYLRAIMLAGGKAEQCMVIEDSERGLTAAKKAGLSCVVIPNHLSGNQDYAQADAILDSFRDLPEYLLQIKAC